jgi:hypothetical protein
MMLRNLDRTLIVNQSAHPMPKNWGIPRACISERSYAGNYDPEWSHSFRAWTGEALGAGTGLPPGDRFINAIHRIAESP